MTSDVTIMVAKTSKVDKTWQMMSQLWWLRQIKLIRHGK